MEELHSKVSDIWSKMKSHYEEAVTVNKRKIENLKKALDDAQSRSQAIMAQRARAPSNKSRKVHDAIENNLGQRMDGMGKASSRTAHISCG